MFIARKNAVGLRGDNRNFDPDAPASKSRAQIIVNLDDPGKSYTTLSPTCTTVGHVCNGPLKTQTVNIGVADDGTIGVQFELHNGITRYPAIDGSIALQPNGQGGYTVHADRNNFPSLGIYGWDGKTRTTLVERPEGSPFGLIDALHNRDRF